MANRPAGSAAALTACSTGTGPFHVSFNSRAGTRSRVICPSAWRVYSRPTSPRRPSRAPPGRGKRSIFIAT
jgi:hypothetical protein